MTSLSPDTVRRIEDAAAALIAAGTPNPTNEQVRQHLGGGSLSHISPVMRAFRARQREQATPLPPELAQLLTGQLGLLWQAAVKQAEAGALAAREQADDDIARADKERDEALANVARWKASWRCCARWWPNVTACCRRYASYARRRCRCASRWPA
ncbi:DNA-binding protein [Escherichia coli]|uniref:DNA-binding protein n=1 Tax=Escherichia coli TaxID=562 RepID=UPI0033364BF2